MTQVVDPETMTAVHVAQLHPLDPAYWQHARCLLRRHPGFLLEGAGDGVALLGVAPRHSWRSTATRTTVVAVGGVRRLDCDPLTAIDTLWQPSGERAPLPFTGGLVGYFGYELASWCEPRLPFRADRLPVSAWMEADSALVRDERSGSVWLTIRPGADVAQETAHWERLWREPIPAAGDFAVGAATATLDAGGYAELVRRAQAHIVAGDIYQANLAMAYTAPATGDPFTCYERLRQINPGPFNGYLNFGDFQILSGSPERLVNRKGSRISARPIAGTRRRGRDARDDAAMATELLLHPKEQAEHVMLVDLVRNDLGRLCRPGTVAVDELMVLESYSHVHHIVSNVVGRLAPAVGWREILRAVFPGGTITGAPKVRAMEIIAALEPEPRGIYTGAIGYLADSGDLDLNIAIRTAVVHAGTIRWSAGAGIVADSIPAREYAECGHKARALVAAMGPAAPRWRETAHV